MSKIPLTRPIKPRGHVPLLGVEEACDYLATLPGQTTTMGMWIRVATLAVKARHNPTEAVLDAFTRQLELALFLTHRLDLRADRSALQELERIRAEIEAFDMIEGASDDTRAIIASLWPYLLVKLRPSKAS
jgi:hypothetical protein